jgi:hypothetical protein
MTKLPSAMSGSCSCQAELPAHLVRTAVPALAAATLLFASVFLLISGVVDQQLVAAAVVLPGAGHRPILEDASGV